MTGPLGVSCLELMPEVPYVMFAMHAMKKSDLKCNCVEAVLNVSEVNEGHTSEIFANLLPFPSLPLGNPTELGR